MKRILLVRLVLVATVIALSVGTAAYFGQRAQLERQVEDLGRRGVAELTAGVSDMMETQSVSPVDALRRVLERAAESDALTRSGRFVRIQVYGPTGIVLAEEEVRGDPDVEAVRAILAAKPLQYPDPGQTLASMQRRSGGLFVYLAAPLAGRHGAPAAYARGVFAVSGETVAEMRRTVFRSMLMAVGLVIGVTVILYPVILRLMRQLADYSTSLLNANLETLAVLGSAIAKRDSDTDAHNYRVSLYAVAIGEKVGLGAADMRGLIKGSFLHDVGKIGIPDGILLKPGRLEEDEYRLMKTHVGIGVDIVNRSSWLRDGVAVVGCHHEQFEGGGYPRGIRAGEIPLVARIFAVADVFDALTSTRPYKEPLDLEAALRILEQGRGGHFDPMILDSFTSLAPGLCEKYAGRGADSLRRELVSVVERYFSSGMEALSYGDRAETRETGSV